MEQWKYRRDEVGRERDREEILVTKADWNSREKH
jgi:hypothetical protein